MSSDDLSHDLEHCGLAMLTFDMSYLLMCCFLVLSIYAVFGWSNKVGLFSVKMFRQMKARKTEKCQNGIRAVVVYEQLWLSLKAMDLWASVGNLRVPLPG